MVRALILFSGTKSVEKAMAKLWPGIELTSVDLSPEYRPDICTDIRSWNFYDDLEHGEFDIVWASPPCTYYSCANQGARDLDTADQCVQAALRIIEYTQPTAWFLENPATGMLRFRPFMMPFSSYRRSTCYCHFGKPYRKATNIWTNLDVRLPMCNKETPCPNFRRLNYHPSAAQKGPSKLSGGRSATGHPTAELWTVPERLVWALCLASGIPIAPHNIPAGLANESARGSV